MYCVKGNKTEEISNLQLQKLANNYSSVEVDLGTGDGRYVYKTAPTNKDRLYIGIDPSQKQLEIYSKKANKAKLANILFLVGSLEVFPIELTSFANKINVYLPWGTLLKEMVSPSKEHLDKLSNLLKENGELQVVLGYDENLEPTETARLDLEKIDEDRLTLETIPTFENAGLKLKELKKLSKTELIELETTWAKKLSYGGNRPVFSMVFTKIS